MAAAEEAEATVSETGTASTAATRSSRPQGRGGAEV